MNTVYPKLMSTYQFLKKIMINNIKLTQLKIFENSKGNIYQGLKISEKNYTKFGEIYFTFIKYKKIKAWKYHTKMKLNLMVPLGIVKFVFIDKDYKVLEVVASKKNYTRITVPPKIWFGFMGLSKNQSLVANLASIEHDDNESKNFNLDYFDYKW